LACCSATSIRMLSSRSVEKGGVSSWRFDVVFRKRPMWATEDTPKDTLQHKRFAVQQRRYVRKMNVRPRELTPSLLFLQLAASVLTSAARLSTMSGAVAKRANRRVYQKGSVIPAQFAAQPPCTAMPFERWVHDCPVKEYEVTLGTPKSSDCDQTGKYGGYVLTANWSASSRSGRIGLTEERKTAQH
jgi:hypothetical protein